MPRRPSASGWCTDIVERRPGRGGDLRLRASSRGYSLPALGFARDAVKRALDVPLHEGLKIEADLIDAGLSGPRTPPKAWPPLPRSASRSSRTDDTRRRTRYHRRHRRKPRHRRGNRAGAAGAGYRSPASPASGGGPKRGRALRAALVPLCCDVTDEAAVAAAFARVAAGQGELVGLVNNAGLHTRHRASQNSRQRSTSG